MAGVINILAHKIFLIIRLNAAEYSETFFTIGFLCNNGNIPVYVLRILRNWNKRTLIILCYEDSIKKEMSFSYRLLPKTIFLSISIRADLKKWKELTLYVPYFSVLNSTVP